MKMRADMTPTGSTATIAEVTDEADVAAGELDEVARTSEAVHFQGMPSDADCRAVYEGLGQRRLIGLHWPEAFGGRGLSALHTLAVEERLGYHWLPLSSYLLSVKTIGNALMQFASPLAARFLPDVAAGRLVFCQGFSEPGAGSDLAALRTTGRLRGDRLVVSGRKIWTSSVEEADWIYLAVRTNPDLDRHGGLSVVLADMSTPGIEWSLHRTVGGGTLGEVVLDDVEVPVSNIVGRLDAGWSVLMGTLDHERVTSEKVGAAFWLLDRLGELVEPGRRRRLRTLRGAAVAARLHGRRATELLASGRPAASAASMAKLSIALLLQEIADAAVDMLGPRALVEHGDGALLDGRLARFARAVSASTIAGGASEIQRRVIARQGLACPR
jgi:3-oxocholest-4-en-26-oyl-CoA dehydrogenase alpha subunit